MSESSYFGTRVTSSQGDPRIGFSSGGEQNNNVQRDFSTNGQLVEEIKGLLSSFEEFRVAWV